MITNCYYLSFLVDEIWLDLQDNIFYFPYHWETFHNRSLGQADWTFILGWHQKGLNADVGRAEGFDGQASPLGLASGLAYFVGLGSFLGLASGPVSLIFQTLSVVPQPLCTVYVGKGCNVSCIRCNFHVSARGWIS